MAFVNIFLFFVLFTTHLTATKKPTKLQEKGHCKSGLCGGMARYPTHGGKNQKTRFYAEFDVPSLPEKFDLTYYMYFNIFFDSMDKVKMNQFVPQLMLGDVLCNSTNKPTYKPLFAKQKSWVFGSQYFFEIFNDTSNRTEAHAATGELFHTVAGEILWTSFELNENWVWNLSMGVVGDIKRTSVVIAEKPVMGLLPETQSWKEEKYASAHVNSCWELYNCVSRDYYPKNGSNYKMMIERETNYFDWDTNWTEDETPTCPGHPTSTIKESHTEKKQVVEWNIGWF